MSLLISKAIALAARLHTEAEQVDKNGAPYILHPLRVMMEIRSAGYPEAYQIVGVLHDTVEDTEVTQEELQTAYGCEVGNAMLAVTHLKGVENYKEYVVRCCENAIGRVVKRYDVYDNCNPRRYCRGVPTDRYIWTLEYLDSLALAERASTDDRLMKGVLA